MHFVTKKEEGEEKKKNKCCIVHTVNHSLADCELQKHPVMLMVAVK